MKIRVVSDGTYRGTRIENAETGELVENVIGLSLNLSRDYGMTASIEVVYTPTAAAALVTTTGTDYSLVMRRVNS